MTMYTAIVRQPTPNSNLTLVASGYTGKLRFEPMPRAEHYERPFFYGRDAALSIGRAAAESAGIRPSLVEVIFND